MTKWARMRKLKEKRRGVETPKISESEEKTAKLVEPEKISNNAKRSQENHSPETPTTFKSTSVLAQIPRYVYLAAIFLLLSGIFFPLIISPIAMRACPPSSAGIGNRFMMAKIIDNSAVIDQNDNQSQSLGNILPILITPPTCL